MAKPKTNSSTKNLGDRIGEPIPPDQSERDTIVTCLDTTMLVEASAGAGKTRSMVDRMIALLSEGKCEIGTLAAITFTRKAAAELRARFQVALEKASRTAEGEARARLHRALLHIERAFVGTIHSFCARLLRERPVEAGFDPSFQELDEAVDARLRRSTWQQFVTDMIATDDPILAELNELGLRIGELEGGFHVYATYPDVDEWPAEEVELPDLASVRDELISYTDHMNRLIPTLPQDSGHDTLIPQYRRLARLVRQMDLDRSAELMEILAEFGTVKVVQKEWPGKKPQALAEKDRWDVFTENTAKPLVELWQEKRYSLVLRAFSRAVFVYDRMRFAAGGMNYQDLLMKAAKLLRDKPQIRQYFRRRFTHLLVDEFQDTDPIQAEVMLLLTATDPSETDWRRCKPVEGSLFVVGDPKQSIYRFRRADIVTYSEVQKIIEENGQTVVLTANFRSSKPIIDWINGTFSQIFPDRANNYSPAQASMVAVRGGGDAVERSGVEVLEIPAGFDKNDQAVEYESGFLAQEILAAISPANGKATASPGDFLIITPKKKHVDIYARRLAEHGIPCEVTGGAMLSEVDQIDLLCRCLEAVNEPDNPVALVSVLRSSLFGLSDEALYAFKRIGGKFSFHPSMPEGLARTVADLMEYAFSHLRKYDFWLKRLPVAAAVERIATDLGLLVQAAVGTGGNVRAGSLSRAIELVRAAQPTLSSVSEIVGYLRQLAEGSEAHNGLPAASPSQAAVRIMNLHQAKGLEAPVVFLSDPTGHWIHEPTVHIDRSSPCVQGYLLVCGDGRGRSKTILARPSEWDKHAAEETQFQDAERNRLLYVATTRAACRLVVSQRAQNNHFNPWSPLADYLADCRAMKPPESSKRTTNTSRRIGADEPAAAARQISNRWGATHETSYAVAAAKAISVTPSRLRPSAGEHGTEWGTVLHLMLERAAIDDRTDLAGLARASLQQQGLEIALAEQALETVRAVMASEIWKRAQASQNCLAEVPFQTLLPEGTEKTVSLPTILRGVIDLVFREDPGWVIVDYKTDARPETEIPQLVEHYRGQIDTYTRFWQDMTGERVAERGLYFTHTGLYVVL